MKVCTCFLLFKIFAYTNSISRIRSKGDHRVAHLPQETVAECSSEEYSGDTNNLDDVHNTQTRGTTLSNRNIKLVFRAPRIETLTDFIQEAIYILNTYENTAFKDFFHVLDNEIRKYHYTGCKFSELMQNSDTRRLLAGSLKLIRGKSVSYTKANINEVADMLRDETYEKYVKELLDYINSLYKNTKVNFHSVIKELKYYRKTKSMKTRNDLVKVIRGVIRSVLFDHYTELNTHTRRDLIERIETFWKQFKNNLVSSAEMDDILYIDPVIKPVVDSIKALRNPESYSKNGPKIKLTSKSGRIVSTETYNEQFQDDEPEMNENRNKFWKPATNYVTDESSSGQSLDSSSNFIKNSQERHEEYNTQRYMTLYTETISYKAKTTRNTEIMPISVTVITRMPKVKKRPTTTSTPRERDVSSHRTENIKMLRTNHDTDDTKLDNSNSSHDTESGLTLESKHKPRASENYDKPRNHGKKHKNAQIISQYDAIIDVQLANTELLKSLGLFDTVEMDTNSRYDTTLYPRSAVKTKPVYTRSTIRPRAMRAQAEIEPQKPTAPTKPPSRYLTSYESFYRKQFDESKRSIVPDEGHLVKPYKKDKKQKKNSVARRSYNDTIGVKDFNKYVNKRIKAIEKELNVLKQMNDFSSRIKINDDNTDEVEVSNVTDKYEVKDNDGSKRNDMKGIVIERLLNENHDLNTKENNDGDTTRSHTMNSESTTNNTISSKSIVIKKEAVNATVIDNNNTSQVTNINVNVTNNKNEINKEVTTNNATSTATSVTNTMKLESVVTTRTVAYSEPSYYDYPVPPAGKSKKELDPFGHISDGLIVNNYII